ncbi:hypothetical protein PL81_07480 [Streptomyces sp. RSD-27]|nr:hypothetical protein PL81_07480 [Streptomyces sp. RSD-27]
MRTVTIDGKPVGKASSPRDLQKILRRAGVEPGHDIQWFGGDRRSWPGCAWRRRATGGLMAAGLLATACLLVRIGKADALNALSYVERIAGIIFIIAGLTQVAAVAAAFDYWHKRTKKYSGLVLLIAASFSGVVILFLLVMQIDERPTSPHLAVWITLAAWSVWALWILLRDHAWKGLRNPQRIALGAVIPLFLAVVNMAYSQVYLPSVTQPLVESTAEFGAASLSEDGADMYVRVHLHVKNSGQIPVYVLGSIFWIKGLPAEKAGRSTRYRTISTDEFVHPAGKVLYPGQEVSEDVVAELDHKEKIDYKALLAQTDLFVVRKDRLRMAAEYPLSRLEVGELRKQGKDKDPQGPPFSYFRYQGVVSNSSELLNATRGRQRVTLWWIRLKGGSAMTVAVATPGHEKPFSFNYANGNNAAITQYGLDEVQGSAAEVPYAELLEKAKANLPVGESPAPTLSGRPG